MMVTKTNSNGKVIELGDKVMREAIIDIHQHVMSCEDVDALVERSGYLGIEKIVLLGLFRVAGNNELVLAASKRYPTFSFPSSGLTTTPSRPHRPEHPGADGHRNAFWKPVV